MKKNAKAKGFILATSYLLLSILSIFSLALFSRENSYLQATERNRNKIVAFNMAEAGIDQVLVQLATNPLYTGTNGYVSMSTSTVQGGYDATVTIRPDNANIWQIATIGYAPSNTATARAYETRSIRAYATTQPSALFKYAVFAKENLTMSGNAMVDSFDSSIGPYNPSQANINGDVGTDSIGLGTVTLSGNMEIKGSSFVGPGGTNTVSLGGNAQVLGGYTQSADSIVTMSGNAVVHETVQTAPSAQNYQVTTPSGTDLGPLSLSGQTNYLLSAGAYQVDSLSISGHAQLTLLGPVTLYSKGGVSISGNGVATSGNLAKNFILHVTSDAGVSLSGNGAMYGAVYAPLSQVSNSGNGELFGAVVSKTYSQSGNGNVHFDEDLLNTGVGGANEVSLLSWREEHTTAGS